MAKFQLNADDYNLANEMNPTTVREEKKPVKKPISKPKAEKITEVTTEEVNKEPEVIPEPEPVIERKTEVISSQKPDESTEIATVIKEVRTDVRKLPDISELPPDTKIPVTFAMPTVDYQRVKVEARKCGLTMTDFYNTMVYGYMNSPEGHIATEDITFTDEKRYVADHKTCVAFYANLCEYLRREGNRRGSGVTGLIFDIVKDYFGC